MQSKCSLNLFLNVLMHSRIDDIQKNIYVAKLLTQVDTKGE